MQLSRVDFIRNHPVKQRGRVSFRGRAGQQYKDRLDATNRDYYLEKRIEEWWVVFEFVIALGPVVQEEWTVEEILAREG